MGLKVDTIRQIRAMGFTARRNEYGIQLKYADCLHKGDHGSELETWDEALSQAQAQYKDGIHCCAELNGRAKELTDTEIHAEADDYHRCGPDSCDHGAVDKDESTPDW